MVMEAMCVSFMTQNFPPLTQAPEIISLETTKVCFVSEFQRVQFVSLVPIALKLSTSWQEHVAEVVCSPHGTQEMSRERRTSV